MGSEMCIRDSIWTVPKKGDKITIQPGMNYNAAYNEAHYDVEKVQKLISENGAAVEKLLPDLEFYVNDERTGMILDYIHDENILKQIMAGETVTVTLDEDCYFMLGDNTDAVSYTHLTLPTT